ncbi:hypothetical protein TEQG_08761 [Trichophyton equinum CBS 127.97]|uniref:Uncharacterized protein n=1 Tax=Trichophyton equinum (strain ATCC MYA-4606 / CBS 127.97) TaxID=559882 RepID=F2Q0G4_TRIEC|nr:hypothetical protein TEQG_08761 [Trichophyton equinum CBS 127.97]
MAQYQHDTVILADGKIPQPASQAASCTPSQTLPTDNGNEVRRGPPVSKEKEPLMHGHIQIGCATINELLQQLPTRGKGMQQGKGREGSTKEQKGRREKARRKSAASLIRPTEARQDTNSLQTPFRLQSSRLSLLPNTAKPSETPCECAYPVLRISVGIIAEDNEGLRPALLGASELVILGRGASL